MIKMMIVLAMMVASASSAFAAGKEINIAVKGMVCGFCAQGIEKKFNAEAAVERVTVSLTEKRVSLTLKEGQDISDEKIGKLLKDSGFNVEQVERK